MAALLGKQLRGSIMRSIRDSITGRKGGGDDGSPYVVTDYVVTDYVKTTPG
jgi:hypothetical protein